MKAKINLENKVKFFALYWGQTVFSSSMLQGVWDFNGQNFDEIGEDDFLSLKPLSSITSKEQDFITSSKICNSTELLVADKIGNYFEGDLFITDFLRSKGYALSFMGLSVEQMVKANWIKILK